MDTVRKFFMAKSYSFNRTPTPLVVSAKIFMYPFYNLEYLINDYMPLFSVSMKYYSMLVPKQAAQLHELIIGPITINVFLIDL